MFALNNSPRESQEPRSDTKPLAELNGKKEVSGWGPDVDRLLGRSIAITETGIFSNRLVELADSLAEHDQLTKKDLTMIWMIVGMSQLKKYLQLSPEKRLSFVDDLGFIDLFREAVSELSQEKSLMIAQVKGFLFNIHAYAQNWNNAEYVSLFKNSDLMAAAYVFNQCDAKKAELFERVVELEHQYQLLASIKDVLPRFNPDASQD